MSRRTNVETPRGGAGLLSVPSLRSDERRNSALFEAGEMSGDQTSSMDELDDADVTGRNAQRAVSAAPSQPETSAGAARTTPDTDGASNDSKDSSSDFSSSSSCSDATRSTDDEAADANSAHPWLAAHAAKGRESLRRCDDEELGLRGSAEAAALDRVLAAKTFYNVAPLNAAEVEAHDATSVDTGLVVERLLQNKSMYDRTLFSLCRKYNAHHRAHHESLKAEHRRRQDDLFSLLPLRHKVLSVLEHPQATSIGRKMVFFNFALVVVTIAQLMLETLPRFNGQIDPSKASIWFGLEMAVTILFTGETILRFALSFERKYFFMKPLNIADVVSVLPFYLSFTYEVDVLKLLRMARFIKLTRAFRHVDVLVKTFAKTSQSFIAPSLFLMVSVLIVSCCVFFSEDSYLSPAGNYTEGFTWPSDVVNSSLPLYLPDADPPFDDPFFVALARNRTWLDLAVVIGPPKLANVSSKEQYFVDYVKTRSTWGRFLSPDCFCQATAAAVYKGRACPPIAASFDSVVDSMWFSIITMTTVGYGDFVPLCGLGKLFTSLGLLLSTIFLAMPIAIVGAGFTDTVREGKIAEMRRKRVNARNIRAVRLTATDEHLQALRARREALNGPLVTRALDTMRAGKDASLALLQTLADARDLLPGLLGRLGAGPTTSNANAPNAAATRVAEERRTLRKAERRLRREERVRRAFEERTKVHPAATVLLQHFASATKRRFFNFSKVDGGNAAEETVNGAREKALRATRRADGNSLVGDQQQLQPSAQQRVPNQRSTPGSRPDGGALDEQMVQEEYMRWCSAQRAAVGGQGTPLSAALVHHLDTFMWWILERSMRDHVELLCKRLAALDPAVTGGSKTTTTPVPAADGVPDQTPVATRVTANASAVRRTRAMLKELRLLLCALHAFPPLPVLRAAGPPTSGAHGVAQELPLSRIPEYEIVAIPPKRQNAGLANRSGVPRGDDDTFEDAGVFGVFNSGGVGAAAQRPLLNIYNSDLVLPQRVARIVIVHGFLSRSVRLVALAPFTHPVFVNGRPVLPAISSATIPVDVGGGGSHGGSFAGAADGGPFVVSGNGDDDGAAARGWSGLCDARDGWCDVAWLELHHGDIIDFTPRLHTASNAATFALAGATQRAGFTEQEMRSHLEAIGITPIVYTVKFHGSGGADDSSPVSGMERPSQGATAFASADGNSGGWDMSASWNAHLAGSPQAVADIAAAAARRTRRPASEARSSRLSRVFAPPTPSVQSEQVPTDEHFLL